MNNYQLFRAHFEISDLAVRREALDLMLDAIDATRNIVPNIAAATQKELDEKSKETLLELSKIVKKRATQKAKSWFNSKGI